MFHHSSKTTDPRLTGLLDNLAAESPILSDEVMEDDAEDLIEEMQSQWVSTRERWLQSDYHNRGLYRH